MTIKNGLHVWNDSFFASFNPTVKLVGYDNVPSCWHRQVPRNQWKRKYHDLWCICKGRGRIKINDNWLDYNSRQLLLIKQGEYYQAFETQDPKGHEIYFMHFTPFLRDSNKTKILAHQWPQIINFEFAPDIIEIFAQLFETYTIKSLGYTLRLKALTTTLMERILWANRVHKIVEVKPLLYKKVLNAHQFIIDNITKDISLDDISSNANLSSSYLSALFHKCFGKSPINFHIICRIQKAKLLLTKGFNVSETADRVGFHSIHQFSKTFKKKTGISPSKYASSSPTL